MNAPEKQVQSSPEVLHSFRWMMLAIAGLVAGFIVWASLATFDVVARAEGKVIPSEYTKTVQNLEGGIVYEIFIRPGQVVDEGELLFRLSDVASRSDMESVRNQITGLAIRISRLEAEVSGTEARIPSDLMASAPQVARMEMEEYRVRQEKMSQLAQNIQLAQQERDIVQKLVSQGLEPQTELLRAERLLSEKKQLAREQRESALSELNRSVTELRSKQEVMINLGDKVDRAEVRSPIKGTVGRVFVTTTGGVVKPGDPMAEIVPTEEGVVIEAKLKPSDVGFIYPGIGAKIKISAYDYAVFGFFDAEVISVSPDATANEKGEFFYTVKLGAPVSSLGSGDRTLPILPGMTAQVDMLTEKRTFLQYVLKPLSRVSDNAFRER